MEEEYPDIITLELPYPPSVNHYWKYIRSGNSIRVYIAQAGIEYRDETKSRVVDYKVRNGEPFHSIFPCLRLEKIQIKIYAYPPDNRKRDLDNILKCLLDSLEHAYVYDDDSRIVQIYAEKMEKVEGGKIIVQISPIRL